MWVTAAAFGLSILAMAVLRLEGSDRPSGDDRPDGVLSGVAEGLKFVWRNKGIADSGSHRPRRHRALPAHGKRAVPQVLHRPQRTGRAGLGTDGVVHRRADQGTQLDGALPGDEQAHDHPGGGSHLRCRRPGDRLPAPLPVILGAATIVGLVYGPIGPIYNSVMRSQAPRS